jgi:hypothetical protein
MVARSNPRDIFLLPPREIQIDMREGECEAAEWRSCSYQHVPIMRRLCLQFKVIDVPMGHIADVCTGSLSACSCQCAQLWRRLGLQLEDG